jgi:hypothetical protein
MISYQYSKKILKKAIIKINDENIKSTNSLNRVVSKNVYSGSITHLEIMLLLMDMLLIQMTPRI